MRRGLAFLSNARPPDYGMRLARLRWARAAGEAAAVADWRGDDPAPGALAEADAWMFVPDPESLPLSGPATAVHTLRELEGSPGGGSRSRAVEFRTGDFRPLDGETIKNYIRRLLDSSPPAYRPVPSFSVPDASSNERPEVVERLPQGQARILDLGCGAGGLGLARGSRPGWTLTGVEKDPTRASRAWESGAYQRLVEGSLEEALPKLEAEGARFDAIVFADVLEHLEDPIGALRAARGLAAGNGLLVAVVPNVGHLSVVRDLLLGRHDPVPSGLCDAGHLRWFSKPFLAEAIDEAGWSLGRIEGLPGAPPPDPEAFLELAKGWPDTDPESLLTYQWIVTARP